MPMAWAEQMPSGRYRGGYRDPAGKKLYVSNQGKGYERKTDAKDAAAEAEVRGRRRAAIADGTQSARITWGEWWDLLEEQRSFADTDTAATERYIVERFLRPKWGRVPLNKITYQAVKTWVWDGELRVRRGMSPAYIHRIYSVFNVSMTKATEGDRPILEVSPCRGVKLPKRPKRPKPYLAVKAFEAMSSELRADYRDALEFDLETGLRPGELCGLHADRLDLDRGWMLVAEVFVKRRRLIRPFPKDDDVRMVPLTERAVEIARSRLEGRGLADGCGIEHTDGSSCGSTLVFRTERNRIMHPDTIGYHMKNAAKKAGVERRSPYAGRRGWATRAAEGGLDAFQIAEILGHSTLTQAQEYVQQTPAARMKLQAALAKYPQLVVLEGGVGQPEARGAEDGADPSWKALEGTVIRSAGNTG
jgi:integrase